MNRKASSFKIQGGQSPTAPIPMLMSSN